MVGTPWGKEPRIAVAQQGSCARRASCSRIVHRMADYRRVVGRVGHWMQTDQGFVDYTEVQVVAEVGEAPPENILPTFREAARC